METMKRLTTLFLVLSLLLGVVGCGGTTAENTAEETHPVQAQSPSVQTTTAPQLRPKQELPELLDTLDAPIVLSSDQADSFYAFLASQQPDYEFYDLFDFQAALDAYRSIEPYSPVGPGIIRNGAVDKEAFLSRLQQNNERFIATATGSRYTTLSDSEFKKVFEIVCTGIDYLLEQGINEALLDEKLGDLKILATTMAANGIMTHQDTILAVNLKSVEAWQQNNPDADKFTSTILHETMHLGQISSDSERLAQGVTVRVGPCFQWEERTPHALFWEWYVEGSAEHLKMDILGETEPSVYEPYVRTLNAMSVALLPTCDPGTIYQLTMQTNPDALFSLFGADTEEAQKEIMNMMCAFDVALAQPDSYDAAYKASYGKAIASKNFYLEELTGTASLTLTKVFYRQLCSLASQETSLSELFSLITAFETEMSRTVRYHNDTDRIRPFINGYNAIQTAFFEQLAGCTGMAADEIEGQFLAWYYREENTAFPVPHLSDEKQLWLQERMDLHAENFMKRKAVCELA